jgi:hypothetical protein
MFSKIIKITVLFELLIIMMIVTTFGNSAEASETKLFASGEEAVNEFIKAVKENNNEELLKIFGSDANELIYSGDRVADTERRKIFVNIYDEQHKIEPQGDKLFLVVGKNEWPFPIPIVKKDQQWMFDTAAGKEEILNRRIGYNELSVIQVLLAIVDAEREYAMENHDNQGLHVYAQKFMSDPNMENGLYWQTKEGEKPSPLGPSIAAGREEGYFEKGTSAGPQPYHGYFYRILTSQGENAAGGAYDYIVNGKMIGGFAVVAWPSEYGNSGVMTFIVNHDGVVYQKDLGENTEKEAKAMKLYNPDKTWVKAQ